jgi:uncharacterized protein (DUF983 family)
MGGEGEERQMGTLIGRALKLRCPRCAGGKLFLGWFRMYEACPNCKLKYERAPGYFLGSAYINYGLTAFIVTGAYMALRYGAGIPRATLAAPLLAFCVGFPLFFFRYARALWLSMDYYFDVEGFADAEERIGS